MYTDRNAIGNERQEARIRNLITAYAVKPLDKGSLHSDNHCTSLTDSTQCPKPTRIPLGRAENLLSKVTKKMPSGYLDFPYVDKLKGQCTPSFFKMPFTENNAQELEDTIRQQEAKAAEPPIKDMKESGWHQVLRAFAVSIGVVVDSGLASDAARIVSALRGAPVTASDMITARHTNYISERELDIVDDPVMAWWRHPIIGIPDL